MWTRDGAGDIGRPASPDASSSPPATELHSAPCLRSSAIDHEHHLAQLRLYAQQTASQFVILFADGTGHTTIEATDAFESHADSWLPSQIRQHACLLAKNAAEQRKNGRQVHSPSRCPEVFERRNGPVVGDHAEQCYRPGDRTHAKIKKRSSSSAQGGSGPRKKKLALKREPRESPCNEPAENEYEQLLVSDEDAVIKFMEKRFRQMQQLMCKQIAKAWIKVIEPKKQSNHPYNRAEDSKPSWWPSNIRHKEPDHLMKPERLQLLLTMLRCQKVPISKLEEATKEAIPSGQSGQIPEDRLPLLDELYLVAKQEDRFRRGELTPLTVTFVMKSPKAVRSTKAAKVTRRPSVSSNSSAASAQSISITRPTLSPPVAEPEISPRVCPVRIDEQEDSASQVVHTQNNSYAVAATQSGVTTMNQPMYNQHPYVPVSPIQTPMQDQGQFFSEHHLSSNAAFNTVNYQRPQHARPTTRHSVSFDSSTPAARSTIAVIPQHRSLSYDWTTQPHIPPSLASPYSTNGDQPTEATWSSHRGSAPPTPVTANSFGQIQLPPVPNNMTAQQHMPPPAFELAGPDTRLSQHFSSPELTEPIRSSHVTQQSNSLSYTAFFEGAEAGIELAGGIDDGGRDGRGK